MTRVEIVEVLKTVIKDGHVEIVDEANVFAGYDPSPEQIELVAEANGIAGVALTALRRETDNYYAYMFELGINERDSVTDRAALLTEKNIGEVAGVKNYIVNQGEIDE